jgi:hypothetical protein
MNSAEEERLIDALAELLADWLGAHPEKLPAGLRSAPSSGLLDGPRAQEQP